MRSAARYVGTSSPPPSSYLTDMPRFRFWSRIGSIAMAIIFYRSLSATPLIDGAADYMLGLCVAMIWSAEFLTMIAGFSLRPSRWAYIFVPLVPFGTASKASPAWLIHVVAWILGIFGLISLMTA